MQTLAPRPVSFSTQRSALHVLTLVCLALAVARVWGEESRDTLNPVVHKATAVLDPRLENAHRLTPKIIAGAEPVGEAAFQALKELGVKTVISVDGAKPNVDLGSKYGLRYVHLPIGYDDVPVERSKELAKAFNDLDGPIYVHCHHGKHRGPAATAVACVVNGLLTNDEALAALKEFGTGENYIGLWAAAKNARVAEPGELSKLNVVYHSVSPVPPLAEAMVHIDEGVDHLNDCKSAGWRRPANNPDIDPAHEALKLHELFTEIARTDDFKQRPADYKNWIQKCIDDVATLETLLRDAKEKPSAALARDTDQAYIGMQNNCKSCHKLYRNSKPK